MDLKKVYEEFLFYLDTEDKEGSVNYVMEKLAGEKIGIVDLYAEVLAPALNNMVCRLADKRLCIWKEHVRSSIIRTIIECCYPFVMDEKAKRQIKSKNEKVLIMCPTEEYHELGARMGADYFTILGYDTIFAGSNTPQTDFIEGIDALKPKYVVICVSNYYNLVAAKKVTEAIKKTAPEVVILAGGLAFKECEDNYKKIGAHKVIDSFEDVANLEGDNCNEASF